MRTCRSDAKGDGVVRWRRIDLKRVIEERFGVVYIEAGLQEQASNRLKLLS